MSITYVNVGGKIIMEITMINVNNKEIFKLMKKEFMEYSYGSFVRLWFIRKSDNIGGYLEMELPLVCEHYYSLGSTYNFASEETSE